MRRGIVVNKFYIDASNISHLANMDFVFVSVDDGVSRKIILEYLVSKNIPFIDTGMGVQLIGDELAASLRISTGTEFNFSTNLIDQKIPFGPKTEADIYNNIQVADLNALNAVLAIIKFKKLFGFYADLEREHFSIYESDGNHLLNEDQNED